MTYEKEIEEMEDYTYQWLPENYEKEDEPILKITKSSLGSYNWCPKKGILFSLPSFLLFDQSVEGRRQNPPPQVEKQYGTKRSPRPDPNGYRNPPNRRVPKD